MILFNGHVVPFGAFPNGESYINKGFISTHRETGRSPHYGESYPISAPKNVVTLKYEDDRDLFRLLMFKEALDFPCHLRITYVPYSRMDRSNEAYTFTLKVFAEFINKMNWLTVTVYEPHSDVTPALLDRCEIVNVTGSPVMRSKINIAVETLTGRTGYQVFYPDAGAYKRYSTAFKTADPLVGFKVRDFSTGRILSQLVVGEKHSDTIVIVDDLCSKGGTFVLAAEKLHEMGFDTIILVVAHCEYTIFEGKVFDGLIDQIITTDSIIDQGVDMGHKILAILPLTEFK